jgi:hypothetical protein
VALGRAARNTRASRHPSGSGVNYSLARGIAGCQRFALRDVPRREAQQDAPRPPPQSPAAVRWWGCGCLARYRSDMYDRSLRDTPFPLGSGRRQADDGVRSGPPARIGPCPAETPVGRCTNIGYSRRVGFRDAAAPMRGRRVATLGRIVPQAPGAMHPTRNGSEKLCIWVKRQ